LIKAEQIKADFNGNFTKISLEVKFVDFEGLGASLLYFAFVSKILQQTFLKLNKTDENFFGYFSAQFSDYLNNKLY
jgi:hypothetical protein